MTSRSDHYFILGPLPGTTMTRYAVLRGDHTVWQVQVSRPEGVEVPQPATLRWRHAPAVADVKVWQVPAWNERGPLTPERHNGQQPRTTWRRAGRTGAP